MLEVPEIKEILTHARDHCLLQPHQVLSLAKQRRLFTDHTYWVLPPKRLLFTCHAIEQAVVDIYKAYYPFSHRVMMRIVEGFCPGLAGRSTAFHEKHVDDLSTEELIEAQRDRVVWLTTCIEALEVGAFTSSDFPHVNRDHK